MQCHDEAKDEEIVNCAKKKLLRPLRSSAYDGMAMDSLRAAGKRGGRAHGSGMLDSARWR